MSPTKDEIQQALTKLVHSNTAYHQCPCSDRILGSNPQDDKVWCPFCQNAHDKQHLQPATAEEYMAQQAYVFGKH